MRYTLMNQEHEVLDFSYDPGSQTVSDVRMLEGAAWAPFDMPTDGHNPVSSLDHLLGQRAICPVRDDLPQILDAVGASSAVELALISGGFSLSDQYWYRPEGSSLTWEDSNFFDNAWDPAFGEAVLSQDYDTLSRASFHTPDMTLGGFCRKAWVLTDGGPRLLKTAPRDGEAGIHCETLASCMLDRLVGKYGHVHYEPMMFGGEIYSSSPVMVGKGEELVTGSQILTKEGVDISELDAQAGVRDFEGYVSTYMQALERNGVPEPRQAMAKMFVMATLVLDFDTHPANLGLIRDVETCSLRLAPFYDHGRAFLFMRDKFEIICRTPKVADLILGLYFSRLDPSWDYSWYDPHALDGFEDVIAESLSAVESLPKGYAELMAGLFVKQRAYVNRIAGSPR